MLRLKWPNIETNLETMKNRFPCLCSGRDRHYYNRHMSRATKLHECHPPLTLRPYPSSLTCCPPLHVANDTTPLPMNLSPIATCEISYIHTSLLQLFITTLFIAISIIDYRSTIAFGSALVLDFIAHDECALGASAQWW